MARRVARPDIVRCAVCGRQKHRVLMREETYYESQERYVCREHCGGTPGSRARKRRAS